VNLVFGSEISSDYLMEYQNYTSKFLSFKIPDNSDGHANFTWEVTSMSLNDMTIQLNFENPSAISLG